MEHSSLCLHLVARLCLVQIFRRTIGSSTLYFTTRRPKVHNRFGMSLHWRIGREGESGAYLGEGLHQFCCEGALLLHTHCL